MSYDQWVAEYIVPMGDEAITALKNFEQLVRDTGGNPELTTTQGSIISTYDVGGTMLYPFGFNRQNRFKGGCIQFNLSFLANRPAFATIEARQKLYDQLVAIIGPMTTKTLNGYPAFAAAKLNDPQAFEQLKHFIENMKATVLGHA